MDNSVVIASGEGRWKEVEEGKGGINGDGRRLDLGDEHNTVYRWCAVQLCTWNLYNFVNQCHPNKFLKSRKQTLEPKRISVNFMRAPLDRRCYWGTKKAQEF